MQKSGILGFQHLQPIISSKDTENLEKSLFFLCMYISVCPLEERIITFLELRRYIHLCLSVLDTQDFITQCQVSIRWMDGVCATCWTSAQMSDRQVNVLWLMFQGGKKQVNYQQVSCPHVTLLDSVSCGQMCRANAHKTDRAEAAPLAF